MTRDDVYRLAREVGGSWWNDDSSLESFAAMVCGQKDKEWVRLFTDEKNQPTQYGTVTLDYMMKVAGEASMKAVEAAIRARGEA